MKSYDIRQFHFHLPNYHSFLRFHKPDKFGDNLKGIRYSVVKANSLKTEVHGFEEGRVYNGFRNVFPIIYNQKHLGSVEISFNFAAIKERLKKEFSGNYSFLIKKEIVEKKVWENLQGFYKPSKLNPSYYTEKNQFLPTKINNFNDKIRNRISEKLNSGKAFAYPLLNEESALVASFLPIKNIAGKQVVYIVSYQRDDSYTHYKKEYNNGIFLVLISTLIVIGLSILLIKYYFAYLTKRNVLKKSEKTYRTIIENMTNVYYRTDTEGKLEMVSPSAKNLFGYNTTKEIEGLSLLEDFYINRKKRLNFVKELKRNNGKISNYEVELKKKNGSKIHVIASASYYYNDKKMPIGIEGVLTNITEQKLQHEELENFFKVNLDLLCIADVMGNFIKVNKAWEKILGYETKELENRKFLDFIHPDDMEKTLQAMESLKKQKEVINFVNRYKTKKGSYRYIEWRSVPAENYIYAAARDITKRIKYEQELFEKNEKLKLALEGGELGTWDWNIRTDEVQFNKRWAEMKGYSIEEIEPRLESWKKLVHPDDMPAIMKKLNAHFEGKTAGYETEFRMQHKSGEWMWILDKGKVIERDDKGNPLRACGTHLDITERKKSEEKLKEIQEQKIKLEKKNSALAMAVTANHEINQPLMILSANMEMLELTLKKHELSEKQRKHFEKMDKSLERIKAILNKYKKIDSIDFGSYSDITEMVIFDKDKDDDSE